MLQITNKLRQRFIKDTSLPIPTCDEFYFNYFLELYNDLLNSKTKYKQFINDISEFNNDEDVLHYYNSLKDKAILTLRESKEFELLNELNFSEINRQYTYSQKDIFKESNIGKIFMSIDLVKANYQVLYKLGIDVCNDNDILPEKYDMFISQFTDKKHFIDSKYIRQVILGNLNPKRQVNLQKYMLNDVVKSLEINKQYQNIISFTNDEIVIQLNIIDNNIFNNCAELVKEIKHTFGLTVSINVFELFKSKYGYVKKYMDDSIEFKSVSKIYFAQNYKDWFQLPIEENDKVFEYEKQLVKFI